VLLPNRVARVDHRAMKPYSVALAGLLLFSPLAHAQEKMQQRSFKWVDAKGVTHYGDSVPAEFSHSQTTELNAQGVELRRSPAQLSPGDAQTADEREAALARQQQHDQFLLATYTSTRDIEQLRDERVNLIEGQIVAARGFLSAAETRMKSLKERAKNFKPYSSAETARRMPDPLAEEIVRTVNEERSQRDIMQKKQAEKDALRVTFQADIDRYNVLIARRSASR
jgi:hypothetical protein